MKQADLARRLDVTEATVSRWLSGERLMEMSDVARCAEILDMPMADLIESPEVGIVGYVGGGAEVINFSDGGELDRTEAPIGGEDTLAVLVRGDSMSPRYDEGQILFYRPSDGIAPDAIGRYSIVECSDGRAYVKRLRPGSEPGTWRLVSVNGQEIDNVEVNWAARVLWAKEA